ncbi:hypothetical protein FKP32DRAFT_4812 [Trametes sanguinea]|nr:hypothetical protein FKP32DRAFT_4812 [Trametes sanguinea]
MPPWGKTRGSQSDCTARTRAVCQCRSGAKSRWQYQHAIGSRIDHGVAHGSGLHYDALRANTARRKSLLRRRGREGMEREVREKAVLGAWGAVLVGIGEGIFARVREMAGRTSRGRQEQEVVHENGENAKGLQMSSQCRDEQREDFEASPVHERGETEGILCGYG